MGNYKLVTTPLAAHFKLSGKTCSASIVKIKKISHVPYSSAVRSLMYAMICTRPDLAYALSIVSRYMRNLGKDHWKAMKWILHYVNGSLDRCLVFDKHKTTTYNIAGFVDCDYGGYLDCKRSTSCYIFTMCVGAIS